jgi:hypothetical protein
MSRNDTDLGLEILGLGRMLALAGGIKAGDTGREVGKTDRITNVAWATGRDGLDDVYTVADDSIVTVRSEFGLGIDVTENDFLETRLSRGYG